MNLCSVSNNFLVIWATLSLLGFVAIFGSSALAFKWLFIDVTFEKWEKKTNPEYPSPKKVRDEIVLMLKGLAFSAICPALAIYLSGTDNDATTSTSSSNGLQWSHAYCTLSGKNQYGIVNHLVQFLGIVLVSDLYEWGYHRLGHVYKPFWQVHRHHHIFYNPSPFSVISDEFVDQFARALPLVVIPMLVPVNMELLFATYTLFFYFYGVYLHCGHEPDWILDAHHPIFNTCYQHYIHHAKSIYNRPYHTGFFFKIWDQMTGSTYPDSKCDCIACQRRIHGPRTREQYNKVVKPDYSVLWKDPGLWWGSVQNDNPHTKST